MSCDGIRRRGFAAALDHLRLRVTGPVRQVLEQMFGNWVKQQMAAASKGGSGSKRSTTGPSRPSPTPPTDFEDFEGVFRSVKKSAEQRQRDWSGDERAEMQDKFDRLWGWLQSDAGLRDGRRPVKSAGSTTSTMTPDAARDGDDRRTYPRISSLAGYAAVWDLIVLIENELAGEPDDGTEAVEPAEPEPPEHAPRVLVFFYGPDIDLQVVGEAGHVPERHEAAHVEDFELVISPLANIVPSPGSAVHGILATATHSQLERLYEDDIPSGPAGRYEPQAVLAMTADGHGVPALTYVSHDMTPARPERGYVDRFAHCAHEYGFPDWYVEHIERFVA